MVGVCELAMPPMILATALFLAWHTACGITNSSIEGLLFRRDAEQFVGEIFQRTQPKILGFADPWLRINHRVRQRHDERHVVAIEAVITLLERHFIAVRITEVVEPGSFIKAIGSHHELIAFPLPYGPAEHSWVRLFRKFAAIGPDDPMHVM